MPGSTLPVLLEHPKLSNVMARALHQPIITGQGHNQQEEEEVDKMMQQKIKEEQEKREKKEMEERMSWEETKEQILTFQEKLLALQEEKHCFSCSSRTFYMKKKNKGKRSRMT
ncbi:hypothetical protein E2I00_002590 [Balaenoptera physalus]|uniref:Uncharacterized protein n=1 Tax=Balaenoptera physalus TaxID=9770 RepID=A0A6A1Q4R9_BALPH|nr:hypothetical protein E2I00_002590 [Balaenoptera physalus]